MLKPDEREQIFRALCKHIGVQPESLPEGRPFYGSHPPLGHPDVLQAALFLLGEGPDRFSDDLASKDWARLMTADRDTKIGTMLRELIEVVHAGEGVQAWLARHDAGDSQG